MADGSIRIDTRLDNTKLNGDLNSLKKAIDSTVKGIEKDIASSGREIDKFTDKFNSTNSKIQETQLRMDGIVSETMNANEAFKNLGDTQFDGLIQKLLDGNKEYQKLISEQSKLNNKADEYKNKISSATQRQSELKGTLSNVKQQQEDVNKKIQRAKNNTEGLDKSMKKVSKSSGNVASGITSGIKKLARYALALMSIRGIYGLLRSTMNEWINSSDASAKQLKADLDNLKTNIGSALAPVLRGVLNIFYKMLAVVGAIVKAFSGINIFAKNTAKSTGASAKNSGKQLASFDQANKLSNNSSGGGDSSVNPTDLTGMMAQYQELADKMKNIFEFIFEPFKKAWEIEGQGVIDSIKYSFEGIKQLGSAVGESFFKIWTNGTVQKSAEIILKIFQSVYNTIGNIGKAYANAWENNGNGDKIVQSIADAFNNLLEIIEGVLKTYEEWTASESFQTFANSVVSIIETLSSWFTQLADMLKNIWESSLSETFTKLLEVFSKIIEAVSAILSALQPAFDWIIATIGPVLNGIIEVIGYVLDALGGLIDFIVGVFTGDWEKAWNGIKDFFIGIWNALKTLVTTIWDFIVNLIKSKIEQIKNHIEIILNGIKTIWNTVWNWIKTLATNIWNGITTTISNVINGIKNTISNVLNTIKSIWDNIWTGLKTTAVNVFNGIWGAIKGVINSILGGIEKMANGIVKGMNKVINALNKLKFTIPDWVPNLGGKTLGFNIGTISEVSIPRLARGGIVMQPTRAIIGEAGREAVLPLENNTGWMEILADKIADKINVDTASGTYTFIAKIDEDELFKRTFQKKNRYDFATNGGGL